MTYNNLAERQQFQYIFKELLGFGVFLSRFMKMKINFNVTGMHNGNEKYLNKRDALT